MTFIVVARHGLAISFHTLLVCLSLLRRLVSSLQRVFSLKAMIAMITSDWLLEEKDRSLLGEHLGCLMMAKAKNLFLLFYWLPF